MVANTEGSTPKLTFTIREAAETLGVHYITMKRWCRDGTVPSFTIGHKRFIPKAAIEALLASARTVDGERS
jgi:excisionase family DNA binding protein